MKAAQNLEDHEFEKIMYIGKYPVCSLKSNYRFIKTSKAF